MGADCTNCPFAVDGCAYKPVFGEGPSDPEGVLIGEGPGAVEQDEGRPFVGPTGEQLDHELLAVGLRRSRLLIINATACRPPPGKTERLMQRAVMACRPVFLHQLKDIDQDVPMFAMGKWAAVAVLGRRTKAIMKSRGFIRPTPVPQVFSTEGRTPCLTPDIKVDSKTNSKRKARGGKRRDSAASRSRSKRT